MKHRASPDFWAGYRALQEHIRGLADQTYNHLKQDPQYPAVRLKKVGRFWSACVGANYRALAIDGPEGPIWFWIGTHGEYDKLLG